MLLGAAGAMEGGREGLGGRGETPTSLLMEGEKGGDDTARAGWQSGGVERSTLALRVSDSSHAPPHPYPTLTPTIKHAHAPRHPPLGTNGLLDGLRPPDPERGISPLAAGGGEEKEKSLLAPSYPASDSTGGSYRVRGWGGGHI